MIPFVHTVAVGALTADSVQNQEVIPTLVEDLYVMSIKSTWSIRDVMPGEGPLQVGWAHSDLTGTEIAEALTAELVDPSNIITKERASRPVRSVGAFHGALSHEALADGREIKTKMRFIVNDGHSIDAWVANRSGTTVTTGAVVVITGEIYGRWLH